MVATFDQTMRQTQEVRIAGSDNAAVLACVLELAPLAGAQQLHVEGCADIDAPPAEPSNDAHVDALVGVEKQRPSSTLGRALLHRISTHRVGSIHPDVRGLTQRRRTCLRAARDGDYGGLGVCSARSSPLDRRGLPSTPGEGALSGGRGGAPRLRLCLVPKERLEPSQCYHQRVLRASGRRCRAAPCRSVRESRAFRAHSAAQSRTNGSEILFCTKPAPSLHQACATRPTGGATRRCGGRVGGTAGSLTAVRRA